MKIKEVLQMFLNEEKTEATSKALHLPGAYHHGRKKPMTPDYWEYGIEGTKLTSPQEKLIWGGRFRGDKP